LIAVIVFALPPFWLEMATIRPFLWFGNGVSIAGSTPGRGRVPLPVHILDKDFQPAPHAGLTEVN
jgi:hypothetical protein